MGGSDFSGLVSGFLAREGYKPCVFAVYGGAGGDRRLYGVWGLKGFSGVGACVTRVATDGSSPERQNPL